MLKKITLSLFLIIFGLIAQINAQTEISPEKQAAINELISLINADNKAEDMVAAISGQMDSIRESSINVVLDERTDLTVAEKKLLRESLITSQKASSKRFQDKLMQKLNFNEMINEIAAIVYDKYFTIDEIKELTAFYRTPTGQKTLKTMTPLMTDTLQLTQERLLPKLPIIFKEIQEEEKMEIEREVNLRKPKAKAAKSK
jgi:uncharacterized protein